MPGGNAGVYLALLIDYSFDDAMPTVQYLTDWRRRKVDGLRVKQHLIR